MTSIGLAEKLRNSLQSREKRTDLDDWSNDWQGFLETHTRIKIKGQGIKRWKFNKAQQDLYDRIKANNFTGIYIVLKLRQETGMTTFSEAMGYCHAIFRSGRNGMSVAHKQNIAEQQFRDVPKILWKTTTANLRPKNITNNSRQLGFENESYYDVACATEAAGRGGTTDFLHITEASRFADPAGTWASIFPSMPREKITNKFQGLVIIETTAHGIDWFYQMFKDAWNKAPGFEGWTALFYGVPWFFDEENNPADKVFLDSQRAIMKESFPEEYPYTIDEAFIASGQQYLSMSAIEKYTDKINKWKFADSLGIKLEIKRFDFAETKDPDTGKSKMLATPHDYGDLHVFKRCVPGHKYIFWGDVAEGKEDGDFTTGGIIDRHTDELVLIYRAKVYETTYARHAYRIASIYNWAEIVIENNGPGHAVMLLLKEMDYPHIYHDKMLEKVKGGASPEPGIHMTNKTKHMIMGTMQDVIHNHQIVIPFRELLEELKTLVKLDGKIKAIKGCHDDLAVGFSHGVFVHVMNPVRPTKKEKGYIRGGMKEFLFLAREQAKFDRKSTRWRA